LDDQITDDEIDGAYIKRGRECKFIQKSPEGNRPLGRSRRRRGYDIKIDMVEMGFGGDRIRAAQGRNQWHSLLNSTVNIQIP
jgi:hypothetical protein